MKKGNIEKEPKTAATEKNTVISISTPKIQTKPQSKSNPVMITSTLKFQSISSKIKNFFRSKRKYKIVKNIKTKD